MSNPQLSFTGIKLLLVGEIPYPKPFVAYTRLCFFCGLSIPLPGLVLKSGYGTINGADVYFTTVPPIPSKVCMYIFLFIALLYTLPICSDLMFCHSWILLLCSA